MASHSSLFRCSCYLRLVSGTSYQFSYNKHKLHHVFFFCQDFTMHELKRCYDETSCYVLFWQAYYITTARELARMVGIRKAPILHHFSESISGAATIRCFNQEKIFLTKAMALIDDYSRVAFHNYATMEWLSVRINFLFNLVFYFVLIILVNLPRSAISPSKSH